MNPQKESAKNMKIRFSDFIAQFSETEWPAIITETSYEDFSRENQPIPQILIDAYIAPFEQIDEHTEFVACLKWEVNKQVTALLYWKAELLNYAYILATYDANGFQIDKHNIAGSDFKNKKAIRRVATITDNSSVHIIEGEEDLDAGHFDPADTDRYSLAIAEDGEIIISILNDTE